MVRLRILYAGRVQGVGFRATTTEIARRFVVDGTVRNLEDGRVEVLAQGDQPEIEAFRATLEAELGDKIRNATQEFIPTTEPTGEFRVMI